MLRDPQPLHRARSGDFRQGEANGELPVAQLLDPVVQRGLLDVEAEAEDGDAEVAGFGNDQVFGPRSGSWVRSPAKNVAG